MVIKIFGTPYGTIEKLLSKWFLTKKIDVFSQVDLNWNQFINCVWNNKEELK